MLLAYIDEIGEPGAFISRDHARFNTHPAFGYAGFIINDHDAGYFASKFQQDKAALFANEIRESDRDAGRWEKKGSEIFTGKTMACYPQQFRVFDGLVRLLTDRGGKLFYYADEKSRGTPKQAVLDPADRETAAMQETLNRLATYAEAKKRNLLVMMDQVDEKQRKSRLQSMYAHILGRGTRRIEMRRIVEPPMHIDSQLSANIQFADWVAACVGRAMDYQLLEHSQYQWVTKREMAPALHGSFTLESKLHLCHRWVDDLHHYEIFHKHRPIYPVVDGHRVSASTPPEVQRKMLGRASRDSRPQ